MSGRAERVASMERLAVAAADRAFVVAALAAEAVLVDDVAEGLLADVRAAIDAAREEFVAGVRAGGWASRHPELAAMLEEIDGGGS